MFKCSIQERELVSSTPSSLNDCTLSTGELFIVISGGGSFVTEPNNISFVFFVLILTLL